MKFFLFIAIILQDFAVVKREFHETLHVIDLVYFV